MDNYKSCKLSEEDLKHNSIVVDQAYHKVLDALGLCEAIPKTVQNLNPDWWKYGAGGTALGILITIISYLLIHR